MWQVPSCGAKIKDLEVYHLYDRWELEYKTIFTKQFRSCVITQDVCCFIIWQGKNITYQFVRVSDWLRHVAPPPEVTWWSLIRPAGIHPWSWELNKGGIYTGYCSRCASFCTSVKQQRQGHLNIVGIGPISYCIGLVRRNHHWGVAPQSVCRIVQRNGSRISRQWPSFQSFVGRSFINQRIVMGFPWPMADFLPP